MWERMFDLVLGLKKEHRLMMVITLIYAVTLFGIYRCVWSGIGGSIYLYIP